ncbi:MAG: sigma-54-dependent Fis family transcriptional regulator [PVC group bacterium]|nr:sigma-54-dependent Fis family transcriptional regulator [PVC group bacterium]
MRTHILVADQEPLTRRSLQEILRYKGYNVTTAENGAQILQLMDKYSVDIIFADIDSSTCEGEELLKTIKENYPQTYVVLMSAYGNIETAVKAMRMGAFDYMTKPIEDNQLKSLVEKIIKHQETAEVCSEQAESLITAGRKKFHNIIGGNESMQKIYSMIEAISDSPTTVLISGESGTGKRMIAQAIRQADNYRCEKSFIEVSCGALPETLLESELFGHVKGSFTGAIKDRAGRFELANGGTFLLDEIDTCSPSLQVKLLRILEEGNYERVGDMKTRTADVRIIAATNQNLEDLVKKKSFREDLYWRLNVIKIEIPPLRERAEDIPLLINHFLDKYNTGRKQTKNGRVIERVNEDALQAMMEYSWPGNIRELENTIERACILVKGSVLNLRDLPDSIRKAVQKTEVLSADIHGFSLKTALRMPEKDIVLNALTYSNWNCTKAAAYLDINRTTLYNKMRLYGIKRGNGRVGNINLVSEDITV